jgi:Flp pilus assembly protein TadG
MAGFMQRQVARIELISTSGSAAIEFAILAPVLALMLFGIIETGLIYYVNSAMVNAANDTARLVRTGQVQAQNLTRSQYIAQICTEMTGMVSATTCNANMQVDMEAFNSFTVASYPNVVNADGSLNVGAMQFNTGNACDTVLVRAFYPWPIITPIMKSLMQNMPNGQFLVTSASAFRNEPFTSGATC